MNNRFAVFSAVTALTLVLSVGVLPSAVAPVHAQQQRGPVRRTIEGRVHGAGDTPLKDATVFLKDSHSLGVRSVFTDEEGYFHFGQLSPDADYELYAEFKGKRSKSKNISHFVAKNDFNFTLKIEAD